MIGGKKLGGMGHGPSPDHVGGGSRCSHEGGKKGRKSSKKSGKRKSGKKKTGKRKTVKKSFLARLFKL